MSFGTFFLPGPTEVRPAVLDAMTRPMIPHRGAVFERLFAELQAGLRAVFDTRRPVYISTSSATGLMEAGVRCAPPGPILALVNGAFSARFAHIAEACERVVDRYEVAWGAAHDPDTLETPVPGLFIAGVVVAGYDANKVFIENGRYHGDKIVARLTGRGVPTEPKLSGELDT